MLPQILIGEILEYILVIFYHHTHTHTKEKHPKSLVSILFLQCWSPIVHHLGEGILFLWFHILLNFYMSSGLYLLDRLFHFFIISSFLHAFLNYDMFRTHMLIQILRDISQVLCKYL